MVKRTSIENLKSRVSLLEVAGRVTTLKKRGHSYIGLSPFTQEKSPSFYVEPDKNVFYCFSSNTGGDVITFIQLTEKLEFYEAVETLADRYNITLEYETTDGKAAPRIDRSLKKELQEIHLYAAEFFHKAFLHPDHPEAIAVRTYWTNQRQFSLDIARDFQVGYAPASSDKLLRTLIAREFSYDALASCGLFFTPRGGRDPLALRPRFRGRLMIPLRDTQGHIIAFTGRKLPATPSDDPAFEAKYVNSPETPIFKKGAMLFNFDRARNAVEAQGFWLMVEGQLDALRAASCGYTATVAPQGTAVTPEQLTLLQRYDNRLRVFLDGDRAGQAAALRLLPMALAAQLDVSFLQLPAGIDPDLFFLQGGPGALAGLTRLTPAAFLFGRFWPTEAAPSAQARATALDNIFEVIATSPSAIVHEAMLDQITRLCGIDPRTLRTEFAKHLSKTSTTPTRGSSTLPPSPAQNTAVFDKNLTNAEFELLWLIVHHPQLASHIAPLVHQDWLDTTSLHAQLLNSALAQALEGIWDPPHCIDAITPDPAARSLIYGLAARPLPPGDTLAFANNALRAIYQKYIAREQQALRTALAQAANPLVQGEILKKQQNLLNSSKKIPQLPYGK